ncbi:MAG: enoyl-CoA hydratase/isomerase family protein [Saprospiraceae bacterium]
MPCTLDRSANIATITFGSAAHNALSSELLVQIRHQLIALDEDQSIKIIVLKSEGDRTFCAGADLNELLSIENVEMGIAFFLHFAELIIAIRKSPHIVLCRVQGKAIGGAVGIVAASDYVIATAQAQIRLSELINGIGPFVVGPAIERKMGLSAFSYMTLTPADWHSAAYALHHGLYNEVTNDISSLNLSVDRKLKEWSGYSTKALKEIKHMFWSTTPLWDELLKERSAISGKLIMSDESKAALKKLK